MRRAGKACASVGCSNIVLGGGTRCGTCRLEHNRARDARRPSRRAAGQYDSQYLRNRARVLEEESHCALCGFIGRHDDTADHIVALADGGTNERENLQRAHQHCNAAKGRGARLASAVVLLLALAAPAWAAGPLKLSVPTLAQVVVPPPAGYITVEEEGTPLTRRQTLNMVGATVTCADSGGKTVCTITSSSSYATIQDEGSSLTQRSSLNFTGNGLACTDNAGATRTDCTLSDAGASAAGVVTTGTQTFGGAKTFNGAATFAASNNLFAGTTGVDSGVYFCFASGFNYPCLRYQALTNKGHYIVDSTSNIFTVLQAGDEGFSYAVANQNDPTLVITSHNQSSNERVGIRHNGTQGGIVDLANTATSARPIHLQYGGTVASAATITPTGNTVHISGTTNIDTITILGADTTIRLIFDGALTVGDGTGNLKLNGNFTTTADDVLTLVSDGTNWFEVGRSVN